MNMFVRLEGGRVWRVAVVVVVVVVVVSCVLCSQPSPFVFYAANVDVCVLSCRRVPQPPLSIHP